jgi:hypothetical protein
MWSVPIASIVCGLESIPPTSNPIVFLTVEEEETSDACLLEIHSYLCILQLCINLILRVHYWQIVFSWDSILAAIA